MLPEQFRGAPGQGAVGGTTWPAEPLSGPTIAIVAALARKYRMYVVAPIRELLVSTTQPPSSEPPSASAAGTGAGAGKGKQDAATATTTQEFNTAVLIGRDGLIVGQYRKMFPVIGPPPPRGPLGPGAEAGVTPGTYGVRSLSLSSR